MSGLASFGAGGFLLLAAFLFYKIVWVPEQERQSKFNADWNTRQEKRISDLEAEDERKEARIERLEQELRRCNTRNLRLVGVLVANGVPVPTIEED
jgi:predicted RNase H-like nuclease (RuvC/YqgF family)